MSPSRRELMLGAAVLPLACASPGASATPGGVAGPVPLRTLGKTVARVEAVSLGGEGVLRSRGRDDEAVPMILAALEAGVRYCDTAPAYEGSQDYYGKAFGRAPAARAGIYLASKTHERTRAGARALLDDTLARLGVASIDLWQMHDLRTVAELDQIFGPGGAIEAAEEAKREGKIRHVGLTGHFDPRILLTAMARYAFDAVLLPVNAADAARSPFLTTVVPEARRQGMGVIGMKTLARGRIPERGSATVEEALRYALAYCDTAIIGCANAGEARSNLELGRRIVALEEPAQRELEARLAPDAAHYAYYKG